jgi:DNA polymerase-3 subunit alpha
MQTTIRSAEGAGSGAGQAAGQAGPQFVHLKVHSAYSLLEGALHIGSLAKLAGALRMPAVGLTDTNNMFGVLEFSDKVAAAGIQPIAGCSLQTDFGDSQGGHQVRLGPADAGAKPAGALAFLCRNDAGYANLMKLGSACHLKPALTEPPHVKIADIAQHSAGLICLTGGPDGPIDSAIRAGQEPLAQQRLERLAAMLPGALYVEIQRHGLPHEQEVEPKLLQLAYALGLPIVATNECYFAKPDDYEAHDALICIAGGNYVVEDNRRRLSRDHYFKSADEMVRLFADLPEALASTVAIAKRCAFRPRGRKPILPRFVQAAQGASMEEQLAAEAEELRRQAEAGLERRLAANPLAEGFTAEDYKKRLDFELGIIARMKFPGYFLIVADFIQWSKANGIPVGPGRGSGAGSVAAWALTITDLDPLRFGLLFERFLNPERISMPDFDIDFCQDRRDEVIKYVQQKYGADRVAQIITHGKLQARAVLRDVGRVLQMPYGQIDKLCKLVPNNPANPVTLAQAIEDEPKLEEARESDPMVARLLEIAQKLEGLYRHASTHAAGMVIGDRPLDELVPLYRDPKSSFPITQFNWKLVEAAGLVKFDFLGLKTLTVLQKAVAMIKRGRGVDIDLLSVPLDDKRSYELLAKADTVGVFQLESTGMRESLKRLRPDRFEDIIAMVALYRPGPMDNIPTYISRKHGEEDVDCLHPLLEPILKETYGVIIYQEQVMQIAQAMAGYSLGEADLLRRAMGKKDKNEMAKQKSRFVEGALKNKVKKADAEYIFELVDKFAGYGFNKSHAAAYALVSYHTAYLKANYREEFLAASMTLDMSNTDKLAMFTSEARKSGIAIEPPCINVSEVDFLPAEKRIRYSLAALKGLGAQAVETVVAERSAKGPLRRPRRLCRALRPQGAQQARAGDAGRRWRLRRLRPQPGAGAGQRRGHPGPGQPHRRERGARYERPVRRRWGQRRASARGPTPGQDLDAHGEVAARVRRGRLLPLRAPARCLCRRARQVGRRHLRRAGGARGPRRHGRPAGRRGRQRPRAPLAEGQQVRVRDVLRAHRPVRGRDLLRDSGPEPPPAGARHGRAHQRGGRARRRGLEAAGAEHRVARQGGRGRPEGRQGRARRPQPQGRCGRRRQWWRWAARRAQGAPQAHRQGHHLPQHRAGGEGPRG